jgi:hypothetical protein
VVGHAPAERREVRGWRLPGRGEQGGDCPLRSQRAPHDQRRAFYSKRLPLPNSPICTKARPGSTRLATTRAGRGGAGRPRLQQGEGVLPRRGLARQALQAHLGARAAPPRQRERGTEYGRKPFCIKRPGGAAERRSDAAPGLCAPPGRAQPRGRPRALPPPRRRRRASAPAWLVLQPVPLIVRRSEGAGYSTTHVQHLLRQLRCYNPYLS